MKFDLKMKAIAFVVIVFAGLFWLNSTSATDNVKEETPQSSTAAEKVSNEETPSAPNFSLQDLEGNSVSLADYRGKVVFVNFWATWCPPCRAEIPHFVELVNQYGKDGFAILGISVDDPKDQNKIPGFKEKYKINYPILLSNGQVANDYGGIRSIPTTFVVDREGKALGKIVGSRSKKQFEEIIKEAL
jgi:peroxiredoxin